MPAPQAVQATVARNLHQPGPDLVGVNRLLVSPELDECLLASVLGFRGILEQIARQGPCLILVLLNPLTESSAHLH
jgi:hypothetical protein